MSEFVSENSAFLLSAMAMGTGCFAVLLRYLRVSRCQEISCWGVHCVRDVIPPEQAMESTIQIDRAV